MKYSNWIQGTRAIRKVPLPLTSRPAPGVTDVPELENPPDAPMVGIRVMTPGEAVSVLEGAEEFAKSRGALEAKPGNPIYEYGIALHTVVLAAVDPDSDPKRPEPFFDGGMQQILDSQDIGQDGVLYLAEIQRRWQAMCGPQATELSVQQLNEAVDVLVGKDGLSFFEQCGPALQWSLVRSLANLSLTLLMLKSSSLSEPAADTSQKSNDPKQSESEIQTPSSPDE